jgi:hypothetical protein
MRYPRIDFGQDIKHLASILFALIPMLLLFFIVSPVSAFIDLTFMSIPVRILIISVIVVVVTAASSYFICRHNPGSAWYVPGFVTVGTLWLISDLLSTYWTRNAKLWLLIIALILATVTGILGSFKGEEIRKE